jgi:hypothetical protein
LRRASLNTEEIAGKPDVGKEAIRFHLKSMCAKTDANQQARRIPPWNLGKPDGFLLKPRLERVTVTG